jgi:tRNA1(Val) A37 N6-methylase TrmN6
MTAATIVLNNQTKNYPYIAKQIKPICLEEAKKDFTELREMAVSSKKITDRCRIGNNTVDFFTFEERLHTRGKYNVSFYEFIERIDEFSKKKFIQNMLVYYSTVKNKNNTKNQHVVWKEVYNICISAINIFRPLVAMEVYMKYKPNRILDVCAGWGGRLIGAAALDVPYYIGIEINQKLREPYQDMQTFLSEHETKPKTKCTMIFEDALTFPLEDLPEYDMAFTSPPYYFLEKYSNNSEYKNKDEMNEKFYVPLFKKVFLHLKLGGRFILNVNKEIYEKVCIPLFGESADKMPLKKSKRQNDYGEYIYVWIKKENLILDGNLGFLLPEKEF